MRKTFAVLGSLVTLSFLGTSALAAGSIGATATADGRTTIAPAAMKSPIMPSKAQLGVEGFTELYSTFNTDPNNAYDPGIGWTISAVGSIVGAQQHVAMPFTPAISAAVRKVVVAVGYVAGTNGVAVTVNADAGGVPGATIKKGGVSDLPVFGSCCVTASITGNGAPLTAGTQYWIVVKTNKATADTWDAWNFNNVGLSGPFAFDTGTGWQPTDGTTSAFSVWGK